MTRKDFTLIAYSLRNARPQELASDPDGTMALQWERTVRFMASDLAAHYPRFNRELFLVACGYTVRPDGAMWRINWETGRIAK